MALVFHDTAASTAAGERLSVSGSTSTSTGRAPTCSITFTEAVNVSGVVITSSPGPTPRVASAVCSPAVQELSASARSEEHTSELQSRLHLGCRLLLEKKK